MKSKILIASHSLDYSGAPIACLSMAIALRDLGYRVSVFCGKRGNLNSELDKYGIDYTSRVTTEHDLYITSSCLMLGLASDIKNAGKIVLPIIHEAVDYNRFSNLSYFDPSTWNLDKYDSCICVNSFQRAELYKIYPNARLALNEYCCLADLLAEGTYTAPCENYIVYPGSFEARKGHLNFINELLKIKYNGEKNFLFLGAQQEQIEKLNIPEYIKKKLFGSGILTPSQAIHAVKQSLALVSLSQSETKGLAVMDALWFDKPVLLNNIPAYKSYNWNKNVTYFDGNLLEFVEGIDFSGHGRKRGLYNNSENGEIHAIHSYISYRERLNLLVGIFLKH